jgi:hypothetical protein
MSTKRTQQVQLRKGSGLSQGRSWRQRYRQLVSLLIIPLGLLISVRALLVGWEAWTLLVMGLAFVALGVVRLRLPQLLLAARQPQGR